MTRHWGWWLACLTSLCCLLLGLGLPVSIPHENNFEWQHAASFPRELRSLSSGEILQPANEFLIRSRAGPAGPRESLPVPGVSFYAETLCRGGPPWFEYRGPPDIDRDPGRTARLQVTVAAPNRGLNYASTLNFRPVYGRILKYGVFQQALAR